MISRDQWRRCRGWLLPAMQDTSELEVVRELLAGRAQLWPGKGAAMVTRLLAREGELYALVWLGGGELPELLAMIPGACAWARAQGAQAARINGRPGWARVLSSHGFVRDGGDLRKAL